MTDFLSAYEQQLRNAHRRNAGRPARRARRLLKPVAGVVAAVAVAVAAVLLAGNGSPSRERSVPATHTKAPPIGLITAPATDRDRAFWPKATAVPGARRSTIRLAYRSPDFAIYTSRDAQDRLCATLADLRSDRSDSPCPIDLSHISPARPFHFSIHGYSLLILPDAVRSVIVDTPGDGRVTHGVGRNMFAFRNDQVDHVYWRVHGQLRVLHGDFGEPVDHLPSRG